MRARLRAQQPFLCHAAVNGFKRCLLPWRSSRPPSLVFPFTAPVNALYRRREAGLDGCGIMPQFDGGRVLPPIQCNNAPFGRGYT